MSKYNRFAKELDTAFKEARDAYAEAYARYQAAENSPKRQSKDYAEYTRANAEWLATKEEFKRAQDQIWDDFNRKCENLRRELEKAVRDDFSATPDAVDTNGLELLKSGILTTDDYYSLANRYMSEDNLTMLRLLSKYADDKAKTLQGKGDSPERGALTHLAYTCSEYKNRRMKAWDSLQTTANYCGARCRERRIDPQATIAMGRRWEQLSAEAVENF